MQDREIVSAIVAGDPGGLAAAYDRYAPALHTYCRSLLSEPADAADAVQDTFVIAAAKLAGLRDPDRLRPWLYAVARNECRRRLRARASSTPLDEAPEMTDESVDVAVGAEQAELAALVGAALAGLNPGEREVIGLNLRHELTGADLADALGVTANHAHALASRARTQFETSLGALLVARTGQESCPELATILQGWDGQLTVLLRKRVNRHVGRCETCGARKRRELSPAMLLSMLPVVLLPAGLREQILKLVADTSPAATAYRERVTRRAGQFRQPGFPEPLDAVRPVRVTKTYALAAGAVVACLAVLGTGAGFAANFLHHARPAAKVIAAAPSGTSPLPSASPVTATPTVTASARRHARRPTPASTTPAVTLPPPVPGSQPPSPTSPAPSPTRSPRRSPSPSPSPPPSPGTLTVSPSSLVLTQGQQGGGPYLGTFTLTAKGGPVSKFSIAVPASAATYLTVTPLTGSLKSGQSVTVTVSAPATSPRGAVYMNTLTANPGGLTITVYYPPAG